MVVQLDYMDSPVGRLLLISEGEILRVLDFGDYEDRMRRLLRAHYGAYELKEGRAPDSIRDRLTAYFDGDITAIDAIPTETGGTPFQKLVWASLREIAAGTTTSYGELAAKIGRPSASRAVGLANGTNPIGIVVPCHRVIGSTGNLTGYGGGLPRKRWLLDHERAHSGLFSVSALSRATHT